MCLLPRLLEKGGFNREHVLSATLSSQCLRETIAVALRSVNHRA
jgi:hypothetical protein